MRMPAGKAAAKPARTPSSVDSFRWSMIPSHVLDRGSGVRTVTHRIELKSRPFHRRCTSSRRLQRGEDSGRGFTLTHSNSEVSRSPRIAGCNYARQLTAVAFPTSPTTDTHLARNGNEKSASRGKPSIRAIPLHMCTDPNSQRAAAPSFC